MLDYALAGMDDDRAMELKSVVEALLFASQKPLAVKEVTAILKAALEAGPDDPQAQAVAAAGTTEIESALDSLRADYEQRGCAFRLNESASGWQVVTRPEYAQWVRQLFPENRPTRLSAPSLETLAIIAYRQPITRADLEAVRGVSVDGVMQTLLDRGLVRIAGRADVPGRPLLYETTREFLDHFALKSLDELPNADELRKVELPAPGHDGRTPPKSDDNPQTEMPFDQPPAGEETQSGQADAGVEDDASPAADAASDSADSAAAAGSRNRESGS